MSISDESPFNKPFQTMRYKVHRVHSAYCYRCPVGLTRDICHIECVDQLATLLEQNHERIAAVIVEPLLQGASGMIVHPVEFLQKVRALCTQYDVLLIADEVLTGFGRTGKMFACEVAAVVPDLMCLSKGITGGFLAMGATVCTDKVQAPFHSENRLHTFYHGHSYTGSALACAAANASLQIFDDEPVFERIAMIAAVHAERLPQFAKLEKVGNVRQIGSVGAIELRTDDAGYLSSMRAKLYNYFIDRGVLLRPLGNVVYVLPPYVITREELHYVYDVILQAIDTVI
jgi:adenosylmethionine-8-amino-7-oxononanoate aminotransferase